MNLDGNLKPHSTHPTVQKDRHHCAGEYFTNGEHFKSAVKKRDASFFAIKNNSV
jgi:hypothetical protein